MLKVGTTVFVPTLNKTGAVAENLDFKHLNAVVFNDGSSDYFTDNELLLVVATSEFASRTKIFVRKTGSIVVEKIVITDKGATKCTLSTL